MSERAAFIRAICEQPEDDVSRLVFADWLEENGEPDRAEFIRAQIELLRAPARTLQQLHTQAYKELRRQRSRLEARVGVRDRHRNRDYDPLWEKARAVAAARYEEHSASRGRLEARVRDLIRVRAPAWCDGLFGPGWISYDVTEHDLHVTANYTSGAATRTGNIFTFARGFPGSVQLLLDALFLSGRELFAAAPITNVVLRGKRCHQQIGGPRATLYTWSLGTIDTPHHLPAAIFYRLPAVSFSFAADAHRALSEACVNYGRELAGLPPLAFSD